MRRQERQEAQGTKSKVGGEDASGDRGFGVACEIHTDAEIPLGMAVAKCV